MLKCLAVAAGYSAAFMSVAERNFFRGNGTGHVEMKMRFSQPNVLRGNLCQRYRQTLKSYHRMSSIAVHITVL